MICRWRFEKLVDGRRVQLRFAEVEGRIVCVGLEVGPPLRTSRNRDFLDVVDDCELDPLTASEIRLPLGTLVDEALAAGIKQLTELGTWARPALATAGEQSLPAYVRGEREKKRPGRPPLYGRDHFEEVAHTYRAAPRAPTKAVAARFNVSKGTAAKWVARARAMELIPPA